MSTVNETDMKRLEQILEECSRQLDSLGISYGEVSSVTINSRAKQRWGLCRKNADNTWQIAISDRLLAPEAEQGLRNTMMHELLHTCPRCANHGAMWKHFAEVVNEQLGYHIKRTSTHEEMGLQKAEKAKPLHRYHCEQCGAVVEKQRICKFTRNYQNYRCLLCGGKFIQEY